MNTNLTAQQEEQNDSTVVKNANESLKYAMQKETEARQVLAQAVETTKIARRKYEAAWQLAESKAVARRQSGLIETTTGY